MSIWVCWCATRDVASMNVDSGESVKREFAIARRLNASCSDVSPGFCAATTKEAADSWEGGS